jgi:hypothetical protein
MSEGALVSDINAYIFVCGHVRLSLRVLVTNSVLKITADYGTTKDRAASWRYSSLTIRARQVIESHFLWGILPFRITSTYRSADGQIYHRQTDSVNPGQTWMRR